MNLQIYSMDIADLTKNANIVKEATIAALERDGLLKKPAQDIAAEYAVVISKVGWFGQLWKRLNLSENKDELRYDIVKSV